MYETIRIVNKLKPKYVIWENVKNLLSQKHRHNFDNYINQMEELGYNSYYQVLNSKDYGIPQNRERVFTISIREDVDKGYTFPSKEELKLRLKDMLEENVDEKYYLNDTQIDNIKFSNFMQEKKRIQDKEYCDTILSRDFKDPKCVRIGGIFDTEKSTHQAGSIYDKEGLSPTLDVMQGVWRQPSVIELNKNPKHQQDLIQHEEGICRTIPVGTHASTPHLLKTCIKIKNATKQGYIEAEDGDSVNLAYPDSNTRRDRVGKEVSQTLTANDSMGTVTATNYGLRIRKLTPLECWRLQGFDDEDFYKAKERLNKVFYKGRDNSNSQLYKQAGNSITVNVLEKIFMNLFKEVL